MVVRRLLHSRYPVRALLGTARRYAELQSELVDLDCPFYVAEPDVMAAAVGFHLNRGVLATADRISPPAPAELADMAHRLVVLEGVGDHENLGAIFRSAAALGMDGVIVGPGCADPLYRRSVRVSMGVALQLPFTTYRGEVAGLLALLRRAGLAVLAMTPDRPSVPLPAVDVVGRRVAVLLGSEGPGLSEAALAAADLRVRIPIASDVDSLNVAAAGAIAFAALGPSGTADWSAWNR